MTAAREPVRTCVGCRARAGKSMLMRIVSTPEGLRLDPSGSAPGRGAYVHADQACVEAAGRTAALGRALRTGLGEGEVGRLVHEMQRIGAV